MEQAATKLMSMSSVYLAIAVVIITFFIRRIVETALPSARDTDPQTNFGKWWQGVILYALPVGFGALLAVGDAFSGLNVVEGGQTMGGQIIYGGIVGWFSGFLYKVFRKTLRKRTGIDPIPGPASVMADSDPAPDSEPDSKPDSEPDVDKAPESEPTKDEDKPKLKAVEGKNEGDDKGPDEAA